LIISLRPITEDDFNTIFVWRNDRETRRYFKNPDPIKRKSHLAWCTKIQLDPDSAHLIGERDGKPVGVLFYNLHGLTAEVSIYLVPELRGRRLGSELLKAGTTWISANHPLVRKLKAYVDIDNVSSAKVFKKSGYTASGQNIRHVEYTHAVGKAKLPVN
jgi:UDP-2,4-diacetamido-2,4,6-trideoxy-beta-L-altropyranose hydrolase